MSTTRHTAAQATVARVKDLGGQEFVSLISVGSLDHDARCLQLSTSRCAKGPVQERTNALVCRGVKRRHCPAPAVPGRPTTVVRGCATFNSSKMTIGAATLVGSRAGVSDTLPVFGEVSLLVAEVYGPTTYDTDRFHHGPNGFVAHLRSVGSDLAQGRPHPGELPDRTTFRTR